MDTDYRLADHLFFLDVWARCVGPRGFPGANTSPRCISGVVLVTRLFGCVAALSAVVACAPVLKPAGPAIRTPAIADGNLITRDNERLPLTSWPARQSPDAVIIALHSFRDYHKAYDELGRWFAARGVSVYAYDQRGFGGAPDRGLWAGTETMVGDLRDAISAVRAANPDTHIFLAGESMGAAVIMALMASPDNPPPVAGIVLVAPAVRGKLVRNPFGDALLSLATITAPGNKTRVRLRPDPTLSAVASARLWDDPLVLRDVRVDTYAGLMPWPTWRQSRRCGSTFRRCFCLAPTTDQSPLRRFVMRRGASGNLYCRRFSMLVDRIFSCRCWTTNVPLPTSRPGCREHRHHHLKTKMSQPISVVSVALLA
jgi:acylglycerol lipase